MVVTLKLVTVLPRFRLVTDVVKAVVAGTTRTLTWVPAATVAGVVEDQALQLYPPSVETEYCGVMPPAMLMVESALAAIGLEVT